MSRAIQVRVSESAVRTIHVEDGVASPLEVLPILAPERMAELLAAELVALGFVRTGPTLARTEPDGLELVVDLAAATVTAKLGATAEIAETVELTGRSYEEHGARVEAALREQAAGAVEEKLDERAEALRRAVTRRLEAKLGELRRELDGAIGRATVAALTEKAAQLGRIEDHQVDDAGNVTIRVRL